MASPTQHDAYPPVAVPTAIAGMLRGAFRDWRGWLRVLALVLVGNILSAVLVYVGSELVLVPSSTPSWVAVAVSPSLSRFFRAPGHLFHVLAIALLVARWLEDIEPSRRAVRRAMPRLVAITIWLLLTGVVIDMAVVFLEGVIARAPMVGAGLAAEMTGQALSVIVRALVFASVAFLIPHAVLGSDEPASIRSPGRWRGTRLALFFGLVLSSLIDIGARFVVNATRESLFDGSLLGMVVTMLVALLVRPIGVALDAALLVAVARLRVQRSEHVAKVFE